MNSKLIVIGFYVSLLVFITVDDSYGEFEIPFALVIVTGV